MYQLNGGIFSEGVCLPKGWFASFPKASLRESRSGGIPEERDCARKHAFPEGPQDSCGGPLRGGTSDNSTDNLAGTRHIVRIGITCPPIYPPK
jgi:hypothetical protein